MYKNDIVVAGHKTRDENDCWMKCHARKDCSHFTYYKISEHPGFNGDCYLKNKKRLAGKGWYGKPKFKEVNHHLSHLIISGEKRCLTGAEAGRNLLDKFKRYTAFVAEDNSYLKIVKEDGKYVAKTGETWCQDAGTRFLVERVLSPPNSDKFMISSDEFTSPSGLPLYLAE